MSDLTQFQPLEFPGATLKWDNDCYLLRLERPMSFLSSAPLGGGLLDVQWVLSQQVSLNAHLPDPASYLRERAAQLGVPGSDEFIGALTAVYHEDLQTHTTTEQGVTVTTLATTGVTNGSSARQKYVSSYGDQVDRAREPAPKPGTINIVTLVDAELTPGALVRASTIATEAKTLALVEGKMRTREGHITTGTSTDVTVVGHTGQGRKFQYAGSATLVGWLIGDSVYHAVSRGLAAFQNRRSDYE